MSLSNQPRIGFNHSWSTTDCFTTPWVQSYQGWTLAAEGKLCLQKSSAALEQAIHAFLSFACSLWITVHFFFAHSRQSLETPWQTFLSPFWSVESPLPWWPDQLLNDMTTQIDSLSTVRITVIADYTTPPPPIRPMHADITNEICKTIKWATDGKIYSNRLGFTLFLMNNFKDFLARGLAGF